MTRARRILTLVGLSAATSVAGNLPRVTVSTLTGHGWPADAAKAPVPAC